MKKITEIFRELLAGGLRIIISTGNVILFLIIVLVLTYIESFKFACFYISFFLMLYLLCRLIYISVERIKNKSMSFESLIYYFMILIFILSFTFYFLGYNVLIYLIFVSLFLCLIVGLIKII
jgi:hypothetical protein